MRTASAGGSALASDIAVSCAITVPAPQRFSRNRASKSGRNCRASSSSRSVSAEAQPSKGEGWTRISTKSAASSAERISAATRGGPSMTT